MFCWGIIIAGVYECYFVNVKDVDFVNVKDVELGYILGSCVYQISSPTKTPYMASVGIHSNHIAYNSTIIIHGYSSRTLLYTRKWCS